jgi:hypothetical protein
LLGCTDARNGCVRYRIAIVATREVKGADRASRRIEEEVPSRTPIATDGYGSTIDARD